MDENIQEYYLTGFDVDAYVEYQEQSFEKYLRSALTRKHQKKMKFYDCAKMFRGELYPVAVRILAYIWIEIPIEQPRGYLDVDDIADYVGHSVDEVNKILDAFTEFGIIRQHPDGIWEVRYRALL